MRADLDPRLSAGRFRHGRLGSTDAWGLNGAFFVFGPCGAELKIIASTAEFPEAQGWEHVSVSTRKRCPNWQEMCYVKDLFWGPEECVLQFHPPRSEWVNNHAFCLHLWRNIHHEPLRPPSIMVGVQELGTISGTAA